MRLRHPMPAKFSVIIFSALITLALPLVAAAQGKIAFVSNRDGNDEIYVMNSDGTNQGRLTFNSASDANPSFSTGGGKIVFDSTRDGSPEIYVMNSDGSNPTRLTNNSANDADPSFSPDGSTIVFTSDRDGNFEIYVMNADGSNPTRLTNDSRFDGQPSFNNDGSKIVFSREVDVWAMNSDGSNPIQLTFTPNLDLDPAFSPDGSKIVFRANRGTPVADEDIYVMDSAGTNQQQLTTTAGTDKEPVFSPDGSRIAFVKGGLTSEIWVMNAEGGSPQQLTINSARDSQPAWTDATRFPPELSNVTANDPINEGGTLTLSGSMFSPDGSQNLSLTVNWGDGSLEQVFNYPAGTTSFSVTHQYLDNLFDLPYTINLTLTTANGSDSESGIVQVDNVAPSLSVSNPLPVVIGAPLILSGTVSDPGTLDTQTVNINWGDGSPVTTLNLAASVSNFSANHTYAASGAYTVNVSASDDDGGTATPVNTLVGVVPLATTGKIAFTSNFGGNNNIWLMNSNGTGQVPLTTHPASDSYPNLSREGSKIVFVSDRDGNPEIYTMNAAGAFQTRLTNNTATDSEPVFNHDGTKIVFSSNRDGNHEIYIMNADGGGQTRLTTDSRDDGGAEFSPDGTKIIFARLAANQSDAHIYTMELNGANQVPLTSGSFVLNGQPSFSPNGQKIVFSSVRPFSGHTDGEVYTMDANGANQQRLTTVGGHDMEPVFGPDGSKIAFRSERDGDAEIYIMDFDGTDQQRITFDGAGVTNFAPSWAVVSTVAVDVPDDLAAAQGNILTVPINVTDTTGKGIVSYDFALNFDPAVLQPLDIPFDKTGTLSANFEVNAGTGTPGRVVISGFGTAPLSGAGTLLKLRFSVTGTPPTSSSLVLDPFVFNEGIPFVELSAGQVFVRGTIRGTVAYGTSATPVGVTNVSLQAAGSPAASTTTAADGTYLLEGFGPGSYTVTPSKTGDVNGITALDASLISQYLVGATTLTTNQQAAAEVSGNGTVTSFDAALIAQYVVLLPNTALTGSWRFLPPSRTYPTVGSLTAENYTAILMGEVSGNWAPGAPLTAFKTVETAQLRPDRGPSAAVTATLPSIKTSPEQLLTIPVSLGFSRAVPAVQAYQFDVIYNPAVLQLEPTPVDTTGTLSASFGAVTNTTGPGRLRLAVYGASPISTSGTLINLKFRVIGRAGSNSTLSFDRLLLNEGNPAVEGKNGKVTVRR